MQTFYKVCLILMIIGGINWGLVGLFQFDFVGWLLGGSSNYLVCDITEGPDYQVGDIIAFSCDYAALATGMCSQYLEKAAARS